MEKATLTKRVEFCSSHRYHNPKWDAATNKAVFGPCNNEHTHGHNYLLEVTLCGPIDPVNGMIINLYDLKIYLWDVLKEFDHKNLNLDTRYFDDRIPTTENLAVTLWRQLAQHPKMPPLDRIRLFEDPTLFADVTRDLLNGSQNSTNSAHAEITRGYSFPAACEHGDADITGHNFSLEVTMRGPIAMETGQVVDLGVLDQRVAERVLSRFANTNVSLDPAFDHSPVTEHRLAQTIWNLLAEPMGTATLAGVSVSAGPDSRATCTL